MAEAVLLAGRERTLGVLSVGAAAFGALAIGRLMVRHFSLGQARIRRLETDELVIGRVSRPRRRDDR